MAQGPKKIKQKRLVKMFEDVKRLQTDETRFCFLLGAGASKSSGIRTGWELSEIWYKDLKEILDDDELAEWERSIPDFDPKNIGAYYPNLYQKRYEISPDLGYEALKRLMEDVEPSLGYVIFAHLLEKEKHNFVITTNFDYLVEDALRLYTNTKPLAVGHELLADYISTQTDRPTIMKVHRDLFLQPFNDEEGTSKMKDQWTKALRPILKNFHLLVVGYGGNDGSLMEYLKSIKAEDRKSIFWCKRPQDSLNEKTNDLLTSKDFVINIKDFDNLMYGLHEVLGYKLFEKLNQPDEHEIVAKAKKRVKNLYEIYNKLGHELFEDPESSTEEERQLFSGAWDYVKGAYAEKDDEKKNKIYQKGLEKYPNDSNLMGAYALFLKGICKDYDQAENYFKKALDLDPDHVINLGNYANFLNEILHETDLAEDYYKRALVLGPDHANNNANYAVFLDNARDDNEKAEVYYKKALDLSPETSIYFSNYGLFLQTKRRNYQKAEVYHKKAIELDPVNVKSLLIYAFFLENFRRDFNLAENYYQKIISLDPDSAELYGNFGNFLLNKKKDYNSAEMCYLKAISLDSQNEIVIGNYAHFLIIAKQDYTEADTYITKAFGLNPNGSDLLSELWFYRYAHYPEYRAAAEQALDQLIAAGAKSEGWDFQSHVDLAKVHGHPDMAKLDAYARALGEE